MNTASTAELRSRARSKPGVAISLACTPDNTSRAPLRQRISRAFDVAENRGRIAPLEGLRGYAVFLVFLVHYHSLFSRYLPPNGSTFRLSEVSHAIGNSGVDLFFVLSGYLIYGHLYKKPISYWSFVARRARRIYPTFLVVLSLYVLVGHLMPAASRLPPTAFGEFVYLAENMLFLPGMFPIEPLLTVSWSLSYEFFFYLSLPVLMYATRLRTWSGMSRIAFFLILLLTNCVACMLGWFPHARFAMFIAGILLWETSEMPFRWEKLTKTGECIAIGLYVIVTARLGVIFSHDHQISANRNISLIWTASLMLAMFLPFLYCIAYDGVLSRFFSADPLRWFGNMSYSYFLFHGFVMNAVAFCIAPWIPQKLHSSMFFAGLLLVNFLLTVVASAILFLGVEKPMSISRMSSRKSPRSVTDGPTASPEKVEASS